MPTISCWRVLCQHQFVTIAVNEYFLHKRHHMPCVMTSSIPSLEIFSTIEDMGGGRSVPATQLRQIYKTKLLGTVKLDILGLHCPFFTVSLCKLDI